MFFLLVRNILQNGSVESKNSRLCRFKTGSGMRLLFRLLMLPLMFLFQELLRKAVLLLPALPTPQPLLLHPPRRPVLQHPPHPHHLHLPLLTFAQAHFMVCPQNCTASIALQDASLPVTCPYPPWLIHLHPLQLPHLLFFLATV